MAAFDYFYKFENFIGYTGDLQNYPTLYFMNEGYYGRITTQHGNPTNVGRAAPKLLKGYTYGNRWISRRGRQMWRLVERNTRLGKRHVSRNALKVCDSPDLRSQVKAWVLYWISVRTEVKQKDDLREVHPFVPY